MQLFYLGVLLIVHLTWASSAKLECGPDSVRGAEILANRCDVEEFTSCEDFKARFWDANRPGIIRAKHILGRSKDHGAAYDGFLKQTSREALKGSNMTIKLSTSVSYTGRVYTEQTVRDYLADDDIPASLLGNETFYLFGNHDGQQWTEFLKGYPKLETDPAFSCVNLDPNDSALSFGCAKAGTGVPWHFHGPGFLQMLHGSKSWFLTPYEIPNERIQFDPNVTTKAWFEDVFLKDKAVSDIVQMCTLYEGDVIFFPPMWRHATYNVVWSSWVSTFLK